MSPPAAPKAKVAKEEDRKSAKTADVAIEAPGSWQLLFLERHSAQPGDSRVLQGTRSADALARFN